MQPVRLARSGFEQSLLSGLLRSQEKQSPIFARRHRRGGTKFALKVRLIGEASAITNFAERAVDLCKQFGGERLA